MVISKDYLIGSKDFKLSWKFTISSMEPNNEQMIYVDANNGNIINNVPLISDANISCTAQTLYSGSQTITGDTYPGGNRLQENRNGVNIQTLNLQNSNNYANATDFANNSTNWTSGSWATFTQDQWALDVHLGAEKVLDFWSTVFTRNSINGSGLRVLSYVHYTPNGTSWPNAQWIGGDNSNFMQYGDGNSTYKPVTALDVSAHEFGHGITQFTCNLTAGTQESGALNEGFSDIWGACVEHWAAPSKQMWLMGEEIFYSTAYSCLRNLQNPKSTTAQEGQHPDTYHGSYWDYNGEPHTNSTVLSHWFYLLSQGGTGTNDINNSYCVYGLGIDVAQSIAYRAERDRLNSSADYAAARTQTIMAANDLYGANSFQSLQVANAWYAVGVGSSPGQVTISGPQTVCYSSASTFTANNAPTGFAISWSVDPATLTIVSGGNTTTPSIKAASSSSRDDGWIQAKFTSSIAPTITTDGPKIKVSVNGPYYNDIVFDVYKSDGTHVTNSSGYTPTLCANTTYHIYVMNSGSCSTSNYSWTIPSGWTNFYTWSNMISINTNSAPGGNIIVSANTPCNNNVVIISGYMSSGSCGGYYLAISPNPATSETTIELMPEGEKTIDENIEWELDVYDQMQGTKAKNPQINGKQTKINTTNWKDGVYIVRAKVGDEIITEKLLVKH